MGYFPIKRGHCLLTAISETTATLVAGDELLEICGNVGESQVPALGNVDSKAFKLAVKFKPDTFTVKFEVCGENAINSMLESSQINLRDQENEDIEKETR